jgi:sortase A
VSLARSMRDHEGMEATSPRRARWYLRLLVGTLAVLIAVAGGVIAAELEGEDTVQAETAAPEPLAPDLTPIADVATTLVDDLVANLPDPEPSPLDARAPTPVVRHGMLEIPSIGLSQPFFEGVTLTAIDNGPSHWPGTPMPGGLGNMVIAGHRVTNTRPFYDLDLVQPGDELIFTMDTGGRHVYTLDRVEIVEPEALHIVDQSYGYTATLFGCHPKGSAAQRIVGYFTLQSSTAA